MKGLLKFLRPVIGLKTYLGIDSTQECSAEIDAFLGTISIRSIFEVGAAILLPIQPKFAL